MNILPLAALSLTVLAASLPLITPVQAGTGVQRCASADGTTVYTDAPCALLGASPRPLPGDVLTRIARDAAGTTPAPEITGIASPASAVVPRRPASAGCARTPTQLTMDLRGSLALADVNRLAESYHWVGLSQKQSKPVMQRLDRLTRQQLEDTQYYDAQIGPGGMQLAHAGNSSSGNAAGGVLQLRFGGQSPQVVDFEVERYAGCYFVRF